MEIIADLEVHSKYARAVSPQMTVSNISYWAEKKGIGLVGTGDFTHPLWLRELEANLEEAGEGIYKIKSNVPEKLRNGAGKSQMSKVKFLLTSEVSCIYSHKGKGRRVHIMVYLPSFSKVRQFNSELVQRGANLISDGRPIVGLTLEQVARIALSLEPKAIIIPAHVWTPWFGFYGHLGGYDSLNEAFGDMAENIHVMETGLSSDPAMNWRIEELEDRNIVSFGDAHSPQKLGREATVLELPILSYENVRKAINQSSIFSHQLSDIGSSDNQSTDKLKSENRRLITDNRISYTIEFYPEEGKYHYTGHRKCKVVYSPNEARKMGMICPVCGRSLTFGVMSRVESLASFDVETKSEKDRFGVRWIKDKEGKRPSYVMLVPLLEIIAEALKVGVGSQKVMTIYEHLVASCGSEFKVLLQTPIEDIQKMADPRISEGIKKVRSGDIVIEPGYDGVFGKVKIWKEEEEKKKDTSADQATLF